MSPFKIFLKIQYVVSMGLSNVYLTGVFLCLCLCFLHSAMYTYVCVDWLFLGCHPGFLCFCCPCWTSIRWWSKDIFSDPPVITSSSTRDYTVTLPDGSTETRTYQWRQSISFQGCQHDEAMRNIEPTQMLNVDQIFVLFDENNEIIRFAMSNKIGDVNGEVTEIILVWYFLFWFDCTSFLDSNVSDPEQDTILHYHCNKMLTYSIKGLMSL